MRAALLTAIAISGVAVPAAAAAAPTRPDGTYTGGRGRIALTVSGRSIDLLAIDFRCGETRGATSVNTIPIKRVRGRWRFSIRTFGLATYDDEHPDENARVTVSGTFSRSGKSVVGRYRIRSPYCGGTGEVQWRAAH
ncbi:MAG TPA: hypothetical protein VF587_18170 [Solirubrobacteraceae bacterium]|jgi:hypothetical protein